MLTKSQLKAVDLRCFGIVSVNAGINQRPKNLHVFEPGNKEPRTNLKILAVTNKAVFFTCSTRMCIPTSFKNISNRFDIAANGSTTMGITVTFRIFHIRATSSFNGLYLPILSISFSYTLASPGIAMSPILTFLFHLSTKLTSGRRA